MNNYITIINEIAQINQSTGAPDLTKPAESLLTESNKNIHIAVLGQFKSGKSSLINSLTGENILPTGVVPVTAIVTRLQYGKQPKLTIRFNNKNELTTQLDELPLYVTEKHNPENCRNVALAIVEHPVLEPFKNISIVDTPGLSSFYRHNSEATLQWLPFTGVAIISVSAERPLAEEDINLIKGTYVHCPYIALVITKTDLFKPSEIEEIKHHISQSLQKAINKQIPIFEYSVYRQLPTYRDELNQKFIKTFEIEYQEKQNEIIRYKIQNAIAQSIQYTELALHTALKREQEKDSIQKVLQNIKANRHHHEREMLLSATSFKSETRDKLEKVIMPYLKKTSQKLNHQFITDYFTWNGSLFKVSRKFEQWLNKHLGYQITEIDNECFEQINYIVKESANYFEYSAFQYRQRLNDRINQMFGVNLPEVSWQIEFSGIDKPDVSVYRAFDSHVDTLLFFLPMRWFKRIFFKHFEKQIPNETAKNLQRYISGLNEKISKAIDAIHKQAIIFIINEDRAVEQILGNDSNKYTELQEKYKRLKEIQERFV